MLVTDMIRCWRSFNVHQLHQAEECDGCAVLGILLDLMEELLFRGYIS